MAQNLMVCQFCETSNETKYKCVNCDLILCEGCKIKIHTKIKKTEVHQVLDLKEFSNFGASETIRHLDLKDIQCSIHNAEQCIIYCEDCKVLLCAICLLESHRTHNLTKIKEVYHKKLKKLQELDRKLCEEYTDLEKEMKQIKSVENDQYTDIKQRILKMESELKENITKQREKLITKLDKLWKPRQEEMSRQLKDAKEKYEALARNKAQIEETFQSHNATAIFTASGKLDNDLPIRPANIISEQKLIFSDTRNLDDNMDNKEIFGSILTIPECRIAGTFTSDTEDGIYKIQTFENNAKFLSLTNKTTVIKSFKLKDSKCITTSIAKDNKVNIFDMTKTPDNKLLFTVAAPEIRCLSTFKGDSKIETLTSIWPLIARGIHATDINILVGFREHGSNFPLQNESRRGILVYDYNCRHMRTYEYDTNNQRLFTLPDTISTNINEDICVIDHVNTMWEGRVVVLGLYGNLKWTYKGQPSINSEFNFAPIDLITTKEGLILGSDRNSNAVHMLSMEGLLVGSLNKNYGIEKPLALNIDQRGQLQIGCSSKGAKDGRSKLYTVDVSF